LKLLVGQELKLWGVEKMSEGWVEYEEFCDMVSENARSKHKVYLSSHEWKEKRGIIRERDNDLCQDCLRLSPKIFEEFKKKFPFLKNIKLDINIRASQVHHLNYDTLHTPQEIDDCISLCEFCHKIKHSGLRYDYKKNVILRNENILKIINIRLGKHPEMIELNRKLHDNFLKSITVNPWDWLSNPEGFNLNGDDNGEKNN